MQGVLSHWTCGMCPLLQLFCGVGRTVDPRAPQISRRFQQLRRVRNWSHRSSARVYRSSSSLSFSRCMWLLWLVASGPRRSLLPSDHPQNMLSMDQLPQISSLTMLRHLEYAEVGRKQGVERNGLGVESVAECCREWPKPCDEEPSGRGLCVCVCVCEAVRLSSCLCRLFGQRGLNCLISLGLLGGAWWASSAMCSRGKQHVPVKPVGVCPGFGA